MRVLHILSQRPSFTGSGVTLDAVVRHAAAAGCEQRVVVGTPADDPAPRVGGLDPRHVIPLVFGTEALPFPVPGMSDVMPYSSTRFSLMSNSQIAAYRSSWQRHLGSVVASFRPDVIHSHHIWLVSALVKDVTPAVPVVNHCHATGLRQLELCPHLAPTVRRGCARNDAFVVLHRGHASELVQALGVPSDRIHVVGAGYRDDLFHTGGREPSRKPSLLFVGKISSVKGLLPLLDAFDRLRSRRPELTLHVAGDGAGPEAEILRARMIDLAPRVVVHGQLPQGVLATLMRHTTVCVLPSFFEGLPLVLVEALACGCRLVATALPGIEEELAPQLGEALQMVEPPAMAAVDTPEPDAVPAFVDRLEATLDRALDAPGPGDTTATLGSFTWRAVFERIERVWRSVGASR
jgi:glycosyltransferase involved in cell wall biosynthesis